MIIYNNVEKALNYIYYEEIYFYTFLWIIANGSKDSGIVSVVFIHMYVAIVL